MANKKISQLAGTLPKEIVSGSYLFVSSAGSASAGYETKKITAQQIAEYAFTGSDGGGFPATQLSGTKNVYFNNTSWDSASNVVTQNPYLQVRQTDGKLVTGSGIGNAVGGDNMGDCTATTDLNLQNNGIVNANEIYFGGGTSVSTRIEYDLPDPSKKNLKIQAEDDLTLSGLRYVRISGQALHLANTPVSGGATITGGNLEIDPLNKIIVNQISGYAVGSDNALLTLEGASTHVPFSNGSVEVDWSNSNIQYKTRSDGVSTNYNFSNVADGQTLTLYYQNAHSSTPITPKFRSGVYGPENAGSVVWGAEYSNEPPPIVAEKTNVYTFVRINTGIFASAVTGYVY